MNTSYIDYINNKLAAMSESELQDFSEQYNFGFGTPAALARGLERAVKGVGKSKRGFVRNFRSGFRQRRALENQIEKMWEGPAPFKNRGPAVPKPIEVPKIEKVEAPKVEAKPSVKPENSSAPKPAESAQSHPLPEPKNENIGRNLNKELEREKELATQSTRFESPAEAINANKNIQQLDRQIHSAVLKGNTGLARELRKKRDIIARKIELSYHKAYSGKLRNIHEWGRDHKLISAPIGIAAAGTAAVGAGGLYAADKAVDAITD